MTDHLIPQYRGELQIRGVSICHRNKELQTNETMQPKPCTKGILKLISQTLRNKEKSDCCTFIKTN